MATQRVGPVRFDNETRAKITLTVETDFDPAEATIELWAAGAWHPCTWTGPATPTGSEWLRSAITDNYFAGSASAAADPADIVLAGASRFTQSRVTSGGDQIVAASTPIDVT